jgi:plastocyanin domain-containing protein
VHTLVVNVAGLALICLIVWWFWLSQPKARQVADDVVDILVEDGVYSPSRIEVPAGRKIKLRFLRKDASPCAEKVLFDELGISADLALGKVTEIDVDATAAGEYEFTCQMRMYRGQLVVT